MFLDALKNYNLASLYNKNLCYYVISLRERRNLKLCLILMMTQ